MASSRYAVQPNAGGDGISSVRLENVPAALQVDATINVDPAANGFLSNGFVVFDYHNSTDFKFAGAYAGSDQWIIGHRDPSGWIIDAQVNATIDALTDYTLSVELLDTAQVILNVDGVPQLSHIFADSLYDGEVGVGTREAVARFDDVKITELTSGTITPGNLPYSEDFEDGIADHLLVQAGLAGVSDGQYHVTPFSDDDGVSTLELSTALPLDVAWSGMFNADGASSGRLSNAFLIFDYVSSTNFKFAGAFVGINQWVIGHRNANDWTTDVYLDASIDALTDYQLQIILESSGDATLSVNGVRQLSYGFNESLTDGTLGLGTKNALARFDDLAAAQYVPLATTTLPYTEDFSDGTADFMDVQLGDWTVDSQQYNVVPALDADGVSTVRVDSLPDNFEILARTNADAAANGRLSNAFIIFDYQNALDFKFAGAYAGSDQWLIGHRDQGGWQADTLVGTTIDAGTDYDLRVTIAGDAEVTLYVDDIPRLSRGYSGSLKDGGVGVGTRNAISRFDDLSVREIVTISPPPGNLPLSENFDDQMADHFMVRSGYAGIGDGRYYISPQNDGDGISTVVLADALPGNVELQTTINADNADNVYLSNAFLIFDYVDATHFNFAGAYVGADQWLIGHRDSTGWVTDSYVGVRVDALTDYHLRVTLETDGTATLFVDGTERVWHTFSESLTDGEVGVGTYDALARFDDFSVASHPKTPLPFAEDFSDGDAEFIEGRSGQWNVTDNRFEVIPDPGLDGVSTLLLQPLPTDFEVEAVINADPAALGRLTNAFVIFDYHGPHDFNFAGAYVGSDQWLIGHRTSQQWVVDAAVNAAIEVMTDYDVCARVTNDTHVALYVDGVVVVSHTYGDSLSDGDLGVGTQNSVSRFDNVAARAIAAPQAQVVQGDPLARLLASGWLERLAPYRQQTQQPAPFNASPDLGKSLAAGVHLGKDRSDVSRNQQPWVFAAEGGVAACFLALQGPPMPAQDQRSGAAASAALGAMETDSTWPRAALTIKPTAFRGHINPQPAAACRSAHRGLRLSCDKDLATGQATNGVRPDALRHTNPHQQRVSVDDQWLLPVDFEETLGVLALDQLSSE